jgi:hypothetical protein
MEQMQAYVGCVAGAIPIEETVQMAEDAGMTDVVVMQGQAHRAADIAEWKDTPYAEAAKTVRGFEDDDPYVASIAVTARRP